ncbi:MAG: site-2 protease family protein [Dehalococcoidia bacterium]|nr:site-2 protease family protein [Dehalococcoidia bacterium]
MVLSYLSVIGDSPAAFLILVAAFVFSMLVGLSFHEFSHALIATALGDPTPRAAGRLTLDPRAHLDPAGSLLILFAGFGWARPVPVDPRRARHPRYAMALIASGGPLANLLLAGLASVPIRLGLVPFHHPFVDPGLAGSYAQLWTRTPSDLVGLFLGTIVLLNVLLAVFNLVPLAPLDGFRVAVGVLPRALARPLMRLEAWGPGLLILLVLMPFFSGYSPLFAVMNPLIRLCLDLFVGGGEVLLG